MLFGSDKCLILVDCDLSDQPTLASFVFLLLEVVSDPLVSTIRYVFIMLCVIHSSDRRDTSAPELHDFFRCGVLLLIGME